MARLRRYSFAILLACLVAGTPAIALEVRQTFWGFDGKVVPGRISPVSLLVANPGGKPFDGVLTLQAGTGIGHSGAPWVQQVYLSPQSERWVQFDVFVGSSGDEFTLSWGSGRADHFDLPAVDQAPPARVFLVDPQNPFAAAGKLRTFPEDLFPTTAAATDSLDGVVLDHNPRWEPARRDAFLDWLKRGGHLLLLPATNGEYPVFAAPLEALNFSGDSAQVDGGDVHHVKASRLEVSQDLFIQRGWPAPEFKQGKEILIQSPENTLADRLASLTRPKIHWWLINLLTVLYLVVIGPVHYRWGRRIDYRYSIAAFVGTVALFGWTFAVVGRRGYDESQTVHSLALARSLGGGRYDVTQWVSAFATSGDIYTLTHHAPSNLYAVISPSAVNGQIVNGKDGFFNADIPLYSSRQFIHRAVMPGDDTTVTVLKWTVEGADLGALELQVGPGFPKDTIELFARYDDQFYMLRRANDRLVLSGSKQNFAGFMPQEKVQPIAYGNNFNVGSQPADADPSDLELRSLLPMLYLRALDGRQYFHQEIDRGPQRRDRLVLYIAAPSPASFHMEGKGFHRERGYVLYVQEVLKSAASETGNSKPN